MLSTTQVAEVFAALIVVGAALFEYFKWRPVRKKWTVIFYLVARNPGVIVLDAWKAQGGAGQDLDAKLDQVVKSLEGLPCSSLLEYVRSVLSVGQQSNSAVDWDDVHVVYRAIWNNRSQGTAKARVVSWRRDETLLTKLGAIPKILKNFADDASFGVGLDQDRKGFFSWVYQQCPAEHYAVCFWGHSLGPGGLFQPSSSVQFEPPPAGLQGAPSATIIDVHDALQVLTALRAGRTPTSLPSRDGVILPPPANPPAGAGPGNPAAGSTAHKVELVLFQDCWMSTLETVFELENVAQFVVGSQSIVPVGFEYDAQRNVTPGAGPVWPYEDIIASLFLKPTAFAVDISDRLQSFYDGSPAMRAPYEYVHFSALQTSAVKAHNIGGAFHALCQCFAHVPKAQRAAWAALGALPRRNGKSPGDWSLLDVSRLATALQGLPPGDAINPLANVPVRNAATQLLNALQAPTGLVMTSEEAPAGLIGLGGVSVLWIPSKRDLAPPDSEPIARQIAKTFYVKLAFNVATTTPLLDIYGDQVSWATMAFEQTSALNMVP